MNFTQILSELFNRVLNEQEKYSRKDHQDRLKILVQLINMLHPSSFSRGEEAIMNPSIHEVISAIKTIMPQLPKKTIQSISLAQAQQIIELLSKIRVDESSLVARYNRSNAITSSQQTGAIVASPAVSAQLLTPGPLLKFSSNYYSNLPFDPKRSFAQSIEMIFRLLSRAQDEFVAAQVTTPLHSITPAQGTSNMEALLMSSSSQLPQNNALSIFKQPIINRLENYLPNLGIEKAKTRNFPLLELFLILNEKASQVSSSNITEITTADTTDPEMMPEQLFEEIATLLAALDEVSKNNLATFKLKLQSVRENIIISFSEFLSLKQVNYDWSKETEIIKKINENLTQNAAKNLLGRLNQYVGTEDLTPKKDVTSNKPDAACLYALHLLALSGSAIALEKIYGIYKPTQTPYAMSASSNMVDLFNKIIKPAIILLNPHDFSNVKTLVKDEFFDSYDRPNAFLKEKLPEILDVFMNLTESQAIDLSNPLSIYASAIYYMAHNETKNEHTQQAKLWMGALFSYGIESTQSDNVMKYLKQAVYYFIAHQTQILAPSSSHDYLDSHICPKIHSRFKNLFFSSPIDPEYTQLNTIKMALIQVLTHALSHDINPRQHLESIIQNCLDNLDPHLRIGTINPGDIPTNSVNGLRKAITGLFSPSAQAAVPTTTTDNAFCQCSVDEVLLFVLDEKAKETRDKEMLLDTTSASEDGTNRLSLR